MSKNTDFLEVGRSVLSLESRALADQREILNDAFATACSLILDTDGKDCQNDQQCPAGQVCNTTTGLCVPGSDAGTDAGDDDLPDAGDADSGDPGGDDCQQDCGQRECGPDPQCGLSCGDCGVDQLCNADGQCVDPLAIVGRTSEPGASVQASVGVQDILVEADSQGNFRLEFDPSDTEAVLILNFR